MSHTLIAYICYAVGTAAGIVMIPLLISELLKSLRPVKVNPIVQETCWLCHKVLGDDVHLYHLAKNTHRVICPKCAEQKKYKSGVEYYGDFPAFRAHKLPGQIPSTPLIRESQEIDIEKGTVTHVSRMDVNDSTLVGTHTTTQKEIDMFPESLLFSRDTATLRLIKTSIPKLRESGIISGGSR